MRNFFKYTLSCLLVITAILMPVSDADAFFIKFDLGKAPSKVTNAIQSIKTKAEEILDGIQNSQFGKFVGKGIEKAKEAKGFVKSTSDELKNTYGKVKDEVENSTGGQMAILSAKIAKLEKKKDNLNQQKTKEIDNIKIDIKIINSEAENKIKAIQNNIDILSARGDNEAVAKSQAQIAEIEAKRDEDIAKQQEKIKEVEEEYDAQIAEVDAEIAELTAELAELAKEEGEARVKKTTDEAIKENIEKFNAESHVVSIKEEIKIKEARVKQMQTTAVETATKIATMRDTFVINQEDIEAKSDVAATAPGESEASNAVGETLAKQIEIMQDLITLMIEDLKVQTAMDVNNFKGISTKGVSGNFNLCDYADPKKVGYVSESDLNLPSFPDGDGGNNSGNNDEPPSNDGEGSEGNDNDEDEDYEDWMI